MLQKRRQEAPSIDLEADYNICRYEALPVFQLCDGRWGDVEGVRVNFDSFSLTWSELVYRYVL